MSYYTQVNEDGIIVYSAFTTDKDYIVPEGHRLLVDNPPNPPAYTPGETYPVRIEPVPPDATEITYRIENVIKPQIVNPNEVLL